MKTSIRKLSLLTYSLFTLAIILPSGCSTEEYYDSNRAPIYSPRQSTGMQTTFNDWSAQETTPSDTSGPQPTILRQGDSVRISFPGSSNLDQTEQVRLDGKISLPLVGDVQAAGLTPEQLQQNLTRLYAPQLSSSDVIVAIQSSAFPIYVTGCVMAPGRILSNQPLTALEAVMEAGGFDYSRANLRKVHIIRRENDSSQSYVVNLKEVLNGDEKNDFYLQPNDIVYVPEKFSWF